MMNPSKITIQPALPSDYNTLAHIEAAAFAGGNFRLVAFGPPVKASFIQRAGSIDKSRVPAEVVEVIKAVQTYIDGQEEIMGWASWCQFTVEKVCTAKKVEDQDWEKQFAGAACPRLCIDSLVRAEELMKKSCGEKDYLKLAVLVTSPEVQRRGVGTMLLEYGLQKADDAALQVVLAASPAGESLYKKHGFIEDNVISLNLEMYEGGQGKGVTRHVIMNRPAKTPVKTSI